MKKERLFIKCELKRDSSHCDFLEHDNESNKKHWTGSRTEPRTGNLSAK